MNKKSVLIYSDCHIYGGSERLMAFLLKNETVKNEFDFLFAYRKHKDYTKGLREDMAKLGIQVPVYPLTLLSNATLFHKINCAEIPSPVKKLIKIPFFCFDLLGLYLLYNTIRLWLFTMHLKPDLIHVNNGGYPAAQTCNQMVFAAKLSGISGIVYQVNNIAYPRKWYFAKIYDQIINGSVRYVITASSKAKEALVTLRHFTEAKFKQIPNTVAFESMSASRTDILRSLNWPENTFLLVQVAFLTERKGQIYLLQALKEINDLLPDNLIKLVLVGNGEDELVLKAFVAENHLEQHVFFAGYRPDSVDFITAADLFLLPSIANEDMPLSLLTAMSNGKPIIASRFAGIAEALKHQESGILIEPNPQTIKESIKNNIIALYTDTAARANLGAAAKLAFNNRYSEETYGRKICELYNESLK